MDRKDTLTWEEFLKACTAFENLSQDLEQDWKLVRQSDRVGDTYLKYSCIRRLSDLLARKTETDDTSSEDLPQTPVEHDDGSTMMTGAFLSDSLVKCEYHIVYSMSYSVPVLYFNLSYANGCLLKLDEVWSMFKGRAGSTTDLDMWSTVSQQDHPVLNLPFFTIHPCHTSRLMGTLWSNSRNPPLSYLITWLSIYGGCLRLHVPNELGKYLDPGEGEAFVNQ